MKIIPPNITPGPFKLEAGRNITTPSGTFYLSYGREKGTSRPFFSSPTELDAIAKAVSAAPDTLAALAGLLRAYENKHGVTISGNTELALAVFAARAALIKAGYTVEG